METVERIAEVVLYEGFLLYPYTRSTMKNQQRWTFGGVYPREYSEASGGDDPWLMQTQCLVSGNAQTEVAVKVRFLHVVDRKVAEHAGGEPCFVDELRVGDEVHRPWEEAIEREIVVDGVPGGVTMADLTIENRTVEIDVPEGSDQEPVLDPSGSRVGSIIREWSALRGRVEMRAESAGADLFRFTVRITNTTPLDTTWEGSGRDGIVRRSLISTHTILRVRNGDFVSLLEPPPEHAAEAARCENVKTWPVLVGDHGERDTILSSPIILYDYPQIAPESHGNFFDTTEIDELMALSVLTLTDDEKREMRETDPRSREILERTESLSPEELMSLHGSIRSLQTLRREE
ncbi:MAG: hypothetical protein ACR2JC_04315 [Chloroflexota bacterium]|nr:MAG: hypothetical protein DLM70_15490 [Chloroflexota bacterium]